MNQQIIELFGGIVAGGALTVIGNVINGILDLAFKSRQQEHDNKLETFEATDKSQMFARAFKGTKGFHKTRQHIAKVVIYCMFVLPMVIPFLVCWGTKRSVTIVFGWYETRRGWLPWSEENTTVQWISIGGEAGSIPILITPTLSSAAMIIIGMFFGNQMMKR